MTTTTSRWWPAGLLATNWDEVPWPPFVRPDIKIEEYRAVDRYVVRAELPGVDPARDLYLGCGHGRLRLHVHRESVRDVTRSEFRYGTAFRTLELPAGACTDRITASYVNGILEITVPVDERPVVTEVRLTVVEPPAEENT
jgi:HSP20 family protein